MPDIARGDTKNPAHMSRHVALVRETGCLRNLGNGQTGVQQQGSSKFDAALNNELMERYTHGATEQCPGM